jgi:hypothetical protein
MELGKQSDYGTGGIRRISGWMEGYGYHGNHAVNNKKTIFMKWKGSDWILHGVFVYDMAQTSTSTKMLIYCQRYSTNYMLKSSIMLAVTL